MSCNKGLSRPPSSARWVSLVRAALTQSAAAAGAGPARVAGSVGQARPADRYPHGDVPPLPFAKRAAT
jgi:hypothetical protein